MAISEQQRFEMHLELRKQLGDDVANTLMEHLPPSGWSDVVRLKDFGALERRLDMRIDGLEERLEMRIAALDTQANLRFKNIEDRMDRLERSMRWLIGIAISSGIAIVGIFIQQMV